MSTPTTVTVTIPRLEPMNEASEIITFPGFSTSSQWIKKICFNNLPSIPEREVSPRIVSGIAEYESFVELFTNVFAGKAIHEMALYPNQVAFLLNDHAGMFASIGLYLILLHGENTDDVRVTLLCRSDRKDYSHIWNPDSVSDLKEANSVTLIA